MAQKGITPIRIPRPKVSPPLILDAKYPLTGKKSHPILQYVRSNVLSIQFNQKQRLINQRLINSIGDRRYVKYPEE